MVINLPYKVRAAIYIVSVVGTPIVAALAAQGVIGELYVALWGAYLTAASALAAVNVTPDK